jgi:hypothetical protein
LETIQFEGIKTGLKQSKDGYILTVAVHPDELPDTLMRDFVGSRYMVVMVRLGDDEKPLDRRDFKKHHPVVAQAGMICRDRDFWNYIEVKFNEVITSEGECAEWFKYYFEVDSRAELKTNESAQAAFIKFKEEFDLWKKQ